MSTMPYDFGDVVVVKFPFTSQAAFKQRPAVVVSSVGYNSVNPDVVLMAITSQLHRQGVFGEIWITEWKAAQLLKPSAIKPVFATIERPLILQTLGRLQQADKSSLRTVLQSILG
jgi:mRNA interferase MazF